MKVLFFVFLALSALAYEEEAPEASNIVEFMKGFLEGIKETGGIEELMKCLKDAEAIFEKIKKALELIKTKKLENVIQGLTMLVDAIKTLLEMVKPCAQNLKKLKELIEKIKHIDIKKIALKIITHPAEVIKLVTAAIEAFKSKNYYNAGKAIGGLLYLLILSMEEEPEANNMVEFMKGFLEGIKESGNFEELEKCLKEAENILSEIKKALELIKTKKLENVIQGLTLLVKAIKDLMTMIQPCIQNFKQLKQLVEKLKHIDIKKIALKIITHPGEVIKLVTEAIAAFKSNNYRAAGKAIGSLLYLLLLKTETGAMNIVEFLTGFLEGLGEEKAVDPLLKCADNVMDVFKDIKEAIDAILKDPSKAIALIISIVNKIYGLLEPCIEGFDTLKALIEKIKKPDFKNILERIQNSGLLIIYDVYKAITAFDKDGKAFGEAIGDILKIMFL